MHYLKSKKQLLLNSSLSNKEAALQQLDDDMQFGEKLVVICDGDNLSYCDAVDVISRLSEADYYIETRIRSKASGFNLLVFFACENISIHKNAYILLKPYMETISGSFTGEGLNELVRRVQKGNMLYADILATTVLRHNPKSKYAKSNTWFDFLNELSGDGIYYDVNDLKMRGLISESEKY